jgi:hypothetical protein
MHRNESGERLNAEFRKTGRIATMRRLSNYKEKGVKMKRSIAILASAALAMFLCAQNAAAFPGERMPSRAAHFAHKVAYKINYHVVHPVRHEIARRLP